MVHGLDKFKDYFGKDTGCYVIIGGTACDLIMNDIGGEFRATKDLDIVLLAESSSEGFYTKLWQFINDGEYQIKTTDKGKKRLYRFEKPGNKEFPVMIEFFTGKPPFNIDPDSRLTPIHISEDISSLSAILLDDNYYGLLKKGGKNIDGITVLREEYLIILKVKAYLDFKKRKKAGETDIENKVKKHRNDIFRLLSVVNPSIRIELAESIKEDLILFIDLVGRENVNLRDLKITTVTFEEAIILLKRIYNI